MIVHHGNNNYKRRYSTCGAKVQTNDSVDPKKVNCLICINKLVNNYFRSRKTPLWEARLVELKNSSNGP
jgi:hypothetical protein